MQEMLFCGTGSFKDVDGKAAAPEAKKKKQGGGGGGGKKENPYASRGLDKFSTVLSELESRREKILRQVGGAGGGGAPGEGGGGGGGEHVLVRFVQSEGKGWVPIVVKLPPEEEEQQQRKGGKNKRKQQAAATSATSSQSSTPPTSGPPAPGRTWSSPRARRRRGAADRECEAEGRREVVVVGRAAAPLHAVRGGAAAGEPRGVRQGVRHLLHLRLVVPRADPDGQL